MRIDLHCHTMATKTGDSDKRNVDYDTFISTLSGKVDLVAITNHNYFDYNQFQRFASDGSVIVWPGIEIDIVERKKRYHCIVVSNPNNISGFVEAVEDLQKENADDYCLTLDQFIEKFKTIDCIVIAHYFTKENSFNDEMVDKLKNAFQDINVFVEPSNLRSATILQAHNYRCLIGSDVENWDEYDYKKLPSLKKKIDSYDNFKLLLQKDDLVIKTVLSEELFEEIEINPFRSHSSNNSPLKYNIYRDVNVFFGGKGTGKTDILSAFKEYFVTHNGRQNISYYKAKEVTNEFVQLLRNQLSEDEFDSLEFPDISSKITTINEWEESAITPTSDYYLWKKMSESNENNKLLGLRNAVFIEDLSLDRFNSLKDMYGKFKISVSTIKNTIREENLLTQDEVGNLYTTLDIGVTRLYEKAKSEWIAYKSLQLEKFTIDKIKALSDGKTGEKSKPTDLGLFRLYNSLKRINSDMKSIQSLSSIPEKKLSYPLGSLEDKGSVFINKLITTTTDVTHYKFDITKDKVTAVIRAVDNCINSLYTSNFNTQLSDLKQKLVGFSNSRDFIGYRTIVALSDGAPYSPSDGEQSMLLLSRSLVKDDCQVYILDEPELSVGHQYINKVIIPRIKMLAKQNKVIIIATHDANIAVRTLPYLSVFRKYENGIYYNYVGSSLEQNMIEEKYNSLVDWTEVSINTLEGGRDAFDERGRIYG